jgi:hypothetical protein
MGPHSPRATISSVVSLSRVITSSFKLMASWTTLVVVISFLVISVFATLVKVNFVLRMFVEKLKLEKIAYRGLSVHNSNVDSPDDRR